jgi:tetratricopeptide (TPR) repeat protein
MAEDLSTTEATEAANEAVEITEKELPKNLKDLVQKARAAVEMNNHKYAVSLMQAVMKEAPGFVAGRRMLREAAAVIVGGPKKKGLFGGGGLSIMKLQGQAKKDPISVLDPIEKELAKDPFNPAANELLFDTALRANLLETAAFALETVRKGNPENTKLLHKLAEFYMNRDMPEKSASVYKDICKRDPSDTEAVKGEKDATARASMQKQKTDSGEYVLGKKSDEETLELEKSSRAALTRDQLESKVAGLVAQYEEDPNSLPTVKELAQTYEHMEDWPNAYAFYDWAHQLSTGDVALKNKAAAMKDKAADFEVSQLESHIEENPDDDEAKSRLKELRSSRVAEQVEERTKRVEQNPTDPQLRYELGLALYHAGEFSDAIPHLQQATRNPHIRTRVLLLLGRTFDAKGMHDLAVKQLSDANEELHAMDNTKKEVLYELGLIHSKVGAKSEALECFKQIYEVDYGYRDVSQRVEQSYTG